MYTTLGQDLSLLRRLFSSTSRNLERDITFPSSAARANPFLKVNTFRHGLSTASLHSRDLLRKLSKERLIVRCSPTSALEPSKKRTPLRLTLASAPSTTLRSTLCLLHLVRRVPSMRIPSQESSHFGRIESRSCRRWRSSAFCGCSSIAGIAALGGALRPEVAWLLGWLGLRLVCLRLLGGRGRGGGGAVLGCS
jgi:hypothetical protein